jgi:hypothetical protein
MSNKDSNYLPLKTTIAKAREFNLLPPMIYKTLKEKIEKGELIINISDEDIKLWDEVQSYEHFKASFSFELLETYKKQKALNTEKEQKLWYKEVQETAKHYRDCVIMEESKENIHYDFKNKSVKGLVVPIKKVRATTINDKTIRYTHCIPSSIDLEKFTWKQRIKILFGIKVNITINTYLNNGKIELTILKIEE